MEVMNIKRKRVMILFIEAAEKMLRESGLASVSIRKVASEVGYNSATLYNYFEDLEHLILFASVRYLREYVASLQKALTNDMSAYDKYRAIYRCFNAYAFKEPEIFHNMFFGKHSDLLGDVLRTYYQEPAGTARTQSQDEADAAAWDDVRTRCHYDAGTDRGRLFDRRECRKRD